MVLFAMDTYNIPYGCEADQPDFNVVPMFLSHKYSIAFLFLEIPESDKTFNFFTQLVRLSLRTKIKSVCCGKSVRTNLLLILSGNTGLLVTK